MRIQKHPFALALIMTIIRTWKLPRKRSSVRVVLHPAGKQRVKFLKTFCKLISPKFSKNGGFLFVVWVWVISSLKEENLIISRVCCCENEQHTLWNFTCTIFAASIVCFLYTTTANLHFLSKWFNPCKLQRPFWCPVFSGNVSVY